MTLGGGAAEWERRKREITLQSAGNVRSASRRNTENPAAPETSVAFDPSLEARRIAGELRHLAVATPFKLVGHGPSKDTRNSSTRDVTPELARFAWKKRGTKRRKDRSYPSSATKGRRTNSKELYFLSRALGRKSLLVAAGQSSAVRHSEISMVRSERTLAEPVEFPAAGFAGDERESWKVALERTIEERSRRGCA
ncbi:hypothetical protein KM043_001776 [Ampulex compressa]|nr:hypothetical protein KM043_001776 [Ampulex compressa]